jgi:RNA polymerase sigma factor (sigma-70 family)
MTTQNPATVATDAPEPTPGTELFAVPDAPEVFTEGHDELDEDAVALDPVRLYLNQIGKVALLTAAQEVELAQRIEAGLYAEQLLAGRREVTLAATGTDGASVALPRHRMTAKHRAELEWLAADGRAAKDHLLKANLRLVVSVAKRYSRPSMPFLDLVQEGTIGLVRAVEKFDYRRGYKFSTYAMWWIRQSLTRAIAEQGRVIRLPVHLVEQVNKLARVRRELGVELGREPTSDELAVVLDLTADRVEELIRVARDPVSLDRTVTDDGATELLDLVSDDDALAPEEAVVAGQLHADLGEALAALDEREAEVIAYRFGLADGREHTLAEIGTRLDLSRERIRQLERDALTKLRRSGTLDELKEYLVG